MQRRTFLTLAAGAALAPAVLHADPIPYTPGLVYKELAAGKTVFVDFYATWCTTCRAQHRVMDRLKAENPAYEQQITFVQVDWDTYKDDKLRHDLQIPRRSTLVVLKGSMELGRIVAGTDEAQIKALFDTALAAATGA
ncbi:MAG: thioredoxin [Limimaricola sp.]|uniref:thioredoxin family protein n=1 Tax=Limimaricola sp. TaxID=2211665 RepID=UPI001E141AF3|nr:thioredoxin family protein [Limimaricola sp.]MBI1417088.1 thioredoxin [Limimaricola sp.]